MIKVYERNYIKNKQGEELGECSVDLIILDWRIVHTVVKFTCSLSFKSHSMKNSMEVFI